MTASDSQGRLDEEIARLRERLESAEEMRRAIVAEQVDAFVVGEDCERVVLLDKGSAVPHALLEHLPHGVVTVSRDGAILYANQRFGVIVGHALVHLFSTSLFDLVASGDRAALQRFLAAGETDSSLHVSLLRPDAAPIAARARLMASGNEYTSFLIVEENASDRNEDAEYALQAIASGNIDGVVVGGERVMLLAEAQPPYRALVDRMQQGAVTVSSEGDVLYANDRFATMVGQARETLLGKRLRNVVGTSAVDTLLAKGAVSEQIEVTLVRGDGSLLPVGITAERVDAIDALTLIVEDLSERERLRAMQERARRNDHFLAVLAHELRNPLGAIRNAAAILERSNLGERERNALTVIARQSETLVRLVDDLLDVHRLNQGKIVLQRKPVDVRGAIDDAVGAVIQNLTAKGQTIAVRAPGETLHVDADPVRIAQVLANLLLNASKFTAHGGRIDVAASRADLEGAPAVRIAVADNGIGIAPDQLEHIFEPYVQASADASPFPEGLGLGLSVAKRLVELHAGAIRAHSDGIGHGSTFTVELPLCSPHAVVEAPGVATEQRPGRARILIADDDADSAATLSSLLQLMGHETHRAHDGRSAIAMADEIRPDLVILDIRMPQLDGHAAARALRERSWGRDVLLYALSGWGESKDGGSGRGSEFDRHFVKPLGIDDLMSAITADLREPRSAAPFERSVQTAMDADNERASRPR